MKRIMLITLVAGLLGACNEQAGDSMTDSDTTSTTVTTSPEDNTVSDYAPSEGDVTYRENRVQVWRGGTWNDADEDVKMDNGVVVYRDGRATRDGKEIELEDGQVVDHSGNIFDRTGRALESAWDHTKEGVKKAGSEIKDVVDDDNNN